MIKIDTDVLEQFNNQLNTLVSDMEETWYLIKYLLNEMDSEELYFNLNVDTELRSAYSKLEELVERFESLKRIMKTVPDDYKEILTRHSDDLSMMGEYAQGLSHTYQIFLDVYHKERVDVLYTNTSPIRYTINEIYNIEGVIKDE